MFIRLLTRVVNVSNHTKHISLSNQQCKTQPTLPNLHHNEYSQWLRYYSFAFHLDRCAGSCNTLHDLSTWDFVLNKAEDLNLIFFILLQE